MNYIPPEREWTLAEMKKPFQVTENTAILKEASGKNWCVEDSEGRTRLFDTEDAACDFCEMIPAMDILPTYLGGKADCGKRPSYRREK